MIMHQQAVGGGTTKIGSSHPRVDMEESEAVEGETDHLWLLHHPGQAMRANLAEVVMGVDIMVLLDKPVEDKGYQADLPPEGEALDFQVAPVGTDRRLQNVLL